jgi:hypothetical protein
MRTSVAGIFSAGELNGIGGLEKALIEGEIAGRSAAGETTAHLHRRRDRLVLFGRKLDRAFRAREEIASLSRDETIVCRCEDVKYASLAASRNWREAKLHSRCGMGPCQGKVCGPATAFLFGWHAEGIRPPSMPATLATLAASCENETQIDSFDRSKLDHE